MSSSQQPVPPPPAPRVGMLIHVRVPDEHWSCWPEWRVHRVNSRSFYVGGQGVRERHLVVEWASWLLSLGRAGTVHVDGSPIRLPGSPELGPRCRPPAAAHTRPVDPAGLLRSARSVVRRGPLQRRDEPGAGARTSVQPEGERPVWRVLLSPDWSSESLCTCRADDEPPAGGLCEHAAAACLVYEDLRCQLLDLFLAS
jgi:hypothetical protein